MSVAPARFRVFLGVLLMTLVPSAFGGRADAKDESAIDHVVLVVLGGGVHAEHMVDARRMPTLAAMAKEGVDVRDVRTEARVASEGLTTLLTGNARAWTAEVVRPTQPTLFERARARGAWSRETVWYVAYEGGDALEVATSSHPAFGEAFGPGVAADGGAFGEPLAPFLEQTGRPNPVSGEGWAWLARLRREGRKAVAGRLPEGMARQGAARIERIERALLTEVDARSLLVRGPAPRDTRAWRAAHTLWQVHRPRLLVVALGEASRGEASADAYFAALRENDRELARLRRRILADAEHGPRTLFVVASTLGRRAEPSADGTLRTPADDEARAVTRVVFTGAGLPRRVKRIRGARSRDVAPTLLALLGLDGGGGQAPEAGAGKAWSELVPKGR